VNFYERKTPTKAVEEASIAGGEKTAASTEILLKEKLENRDKEK